MEEERKYASLPLMRDVLSVVDNLDPGFTVQEGEWGTCENGYCEGTCYGPDFRYAEPGCFSCLAIFHVEVPNAGEYDVCTLVFSRFQSVISQEPTALQVIPASFDAPEEGAASSSLYDYEPSEEGVLADLLPRGVATQVFAALLENGASEQVARMSALDNATRNAGDMIDRLTIQFNRTRQAVITNELIEIISGAEAL